MTQTTVVNPPAASPARVSRGASTLLSFRFVAVAGFLVLAATSLEVLRTQVGWTFRKEPVPLKTGFYAFRSSMIGPRYQRHDIDMPPIEEEALQTLGTREYLNVRIVDRLKDRSDPTRNAWVFVTYYTGKPDMVPHVPDECYVAGGYDRAGPPETVRVEVPGVGAPDDEVPVRMLTFRSRAQTINEIAAEQDTLSVMYFFLANNDYTTTRTGVRTRLFNLRERYAYYAKFEFRFTDESARRQATKEESLEALGPLLERFLPAVLEHHFYDWEEFTSRDKAEDDASAATNAVGKDEA